MLNVSSRRRGTQGQLARELRSQSKEEVVFHEPHKVSVILTTTYYAASRDSQMHQAVHYAT